jgi:uncharacterized membrane protein YhaH (DUF805 family)
MNFAQAIASGFRKYVNFSDRAPRSEYWFWTLFVVLAVSAAGLIDYALFHNADMSPLSGIVGLGLFLPGLAVSIRRLHDLDRTGWWYLLIFTGIGAIVLLVWWCMRGTIGSNRFGQDPLGGRVP